MAHERIRMLVDDPRPTRRGAVGLSAGDVLTVGEAASFDVSPEGAAGMVEDGVAEWVEA